MDNRLGWQIHQGLNSIRSKHVLWSHPLVELFGSEQAQRETGLLERSPLLVRLLGRLDEDLRTHERERRQRRAKREGMEGYLGGVVVADVRVQGSDEHEGFVEQLIDPLLVRLNADDAMLGEGERSIGDQSDGVEYVPVHHGY